ncbi:helicase [Seminavis robusta]|uniref:Helicase n=1 Tax=Seminavis robusta TaxID=568900 RepID=A0A9N8HQ22_9STRA|nr:helicase [Seminavis robusta]|eukprot:Sro946_g223260.1 helicase (390) ;mRNA; r:18971-20140
MWERKLERLKEFRRNFGHSNVPQSATFDADLFAWAQELGAWVQGQRQLYKQQRLLPHRLLKLEAIGFQWVLCARTKEKDSTKDDKKWQAMYLQLVDFQHQHGHVNVAKPHRNAPQDYRKLAHWVSTQRCDQKSGILRKNRKNLLDSLGFVWRMEKGDAAAWEDYYQELIKFNELNGHFNIPTKHRSFHWAHFQRRARRQGTLSKEKEEALNKIGFNWESKKRGWNMKKGTDEREVHDKRRKTARERKEHVGSRVAVYWSDDDEYYEGVVTREQKDGTFHVRYDDGESEWVSPDAFQFKFLKDGKSAKLDNGKVELLAKLAKGTRVAVWWPSEEEYFNATVMKICNDNVNPHYLWYDDGDSQQTNLLYTKFKLLEDDPKDNLECTLSCTL